MGKIDSISQILQTEHGLDLSTGKYVNLNEKTIDAHEVSVIEDKPVEDESNDVSLDKTKDHIEDEENVKRNLRSLIEKSMDLADDMIETVRITESPKAYEPASIFLKTLIELNESLLDVHDRDRKMKLKNSQPKNKGTTTTNNTQNNTVIYATPAEMLKARKKLKDGDKE